MRIQVLFFSILVIGGSALSTGGKEISAAQDQNQNQCFDFSRKLVQPLKHFDPTRIIFSAYLLAG